MQGIEIKPKINMAYLPENKPAMVWMMAASPKGEGFTAIFEGFEIKGFTKV